MFKSYFFLGLGIGMILSGSLFLAFSDDSGKTAKKPEAEFAQNEKKEDIESENFKKLLKEIEELKDNGNKTESSEIISDEKNIAEKTEDSVEKNLVENQANKINETSKKTEDKEEKKQITEEKNIEEKKNEEKKTKEEKKNIVKVEKTSTEDNKTASDNKTKTDKKSVEEIKKGKITILEDKEKNTLAYRISAEKYQIQFRSSKSFNNCERIRNILKDVIDTETVLVGEYYRVLSNETFSEEIAKDVAEKIGKLYNLKTVVWFSDYTLIFKKDKDIKNCESLQKKIAQYVDTIINFENNLYILTTKKPLAKNLAIDVAKYINKEITLDVTIKQNI